MFEQTCNLVIDFLQNHYLLMRLMSCFFIGFWWCASGTLLQWSTQNPLACPVTLGLTSLPVACWLLSYLLGFHTDRVEVLCSLLAIFVIIHYLFYLQLKTSKNSSIMSNSKIIMMGIALNLSLAAIYSFFHFYFSSQGKVMPNALWFGMIKNMDPYKFIILILGSFIFLGLIFQIMPKLNLMSLGKSYAQNVCDVNLIEKQMMIIISLLMCLLILTGGVFAFWGLVLPHLVRRIGIFRNSLSKEFYSGSAFAGLLMMIADFLCYEFPVSGSELPVGLLTSVLGPILLIGLLFKNNSKSI